MKFFDSRVAFEIFRSVYVTTYIAKIKMVSLKRNVGFSYPGDTPAPTPCSIEPIFDEES